MPTASPREASPLVTTARVDLRDNDVALGVSGHHGENLKAIERRLGVRVGQRGTELHLSGPPDAVAFAVRLVEQLETILRAGHPVGREDVEQGLKLLGRSTAPEETLDSLVLGPVLSRGGRHVAPKSRGAEGATSTPSASTTSSSASARPAPARPTWRWRWRWPPSRSGR